MDKIVKKPLVSVVMPVYNAGKFLREAIESILLQTFSDFEFIIIHDGSSDGSLDIIREYEDNRIKVIVHTQNKGFAYSVNEGYALAVGKYVARMDADDISVVGRFAEQIKYLEKNPGVAVCGTWAKAINEDGILLFNMKSPTGIVLKYNYWKPSPLIHPSVMLNKRLLGEIVLNHKYSPAEDYDLWLRLSKKFKVVNIMKYLIFYRINKNGMSNSNFDRRARSSWSVFIDNIGLRDITFNDYCSLACLSYKMSWWKRLKLLFILSNWIKYPIGFMFLDNGYYVFRQLLYNIKPSLKRF